MEFMSVSTFDVA